MNETSLVDAPNAQLQLALDAIERNTSLGPATRAQYTRAVTNAVAAGVDLLDPDSLWAYGNAVGSSTRAFLSAVITTITARIENQAMSQATPENVAAVTATIYRARALREAVTVSPVKGQNAHTWLSAAQVRHLFRATEQRRSGNAESAIVALRDRVVLGLLLGAGLRRTEAVELTFADIKRQPVGDHVRTVLEIRGKGDKVRQVPISTPLSGLIDEWGEVVGREGRVLRSLGREKQPGESISSAAIYTIVRKRGALIKCENLQPHDLRRTFAQLGFEAGVPITQISVLLGHTSVATTQRYLNLELDLETTVSDFIPVDLPG